MTPITFVKEYKVLIASSPRTSLTHAMLISKHSLSVSKHIHWDFVPPLECDWNVDIKLEKLWGLNVSITHSVHYKAKYTHSQGCMISSSK